MRSAHHAVVREVLDRIERDPGTLPFQDVPGAAAAFGSRGNLLRALQMRWHAQLAAQLDAALEAAGPSVSTAAQAYRDSIAARPALRATLDRHRDEPALRAGEESELALLATAAGLTEPGATGARTVGLGKQVRAEITAHPSAGERPALARRGARCRAAGWLRRLRAASAA